MASTALLHGPAPPRAGGAARPSLALRLRVVAHRLELTRRLADGADPLASDELALRARRLTSPRELGDCIKGLERVLRDAAGPPRGITARAPLQREAIHAARPFLEYLLERLRETDDPRPAGVARTVLLLTDGCGPIYAPSPPGTLASRAFRAATPL